MCPKLRGANLPSIFAPRSFGPLNLRPAEFWTPQSVPRGVLEQCNVCPAFSWRHSYGGLNIHKKSSNVYFSYFFAGYFCKPLSFQRSIQPIWPFVKKKIFHGTVPLTAEQWPSSFKIGEGDPSKLCSANFGGSYNSEPPYLGHHSILKDRSCQKRMMIEICSDSAACSVTVSQCGSVSGRDCDVTN